jgi:hypothetical protein
MDEIIKAGESIEDIREQEYDTLESMLNMLAPESSIIIDKNIGLIGYTDDKKDEERIRLFNLKRGYKEYETLKIGRLNDWSGTRRDICKKGSSFKVVDSNGCILFDEKVNRVYKLLTDDGQDMYVFFIKDREATQTFDDFFDEDDYCPAVLLLVGDKLYINDSKDEELTSKYDVNTDIILVEDKAYMWGIEYRGDVYRPAPLSINNNIFVCRKVKMRL